MKKILKIVLLLVAAVVFLIISFLLFVNFAGIPSYEAKDVDFKVEYSDEKLENGIKLAGLVCNHCHRSSNSIVLTGRKVEDMNPEFGVVYSQNITQSKEKGIGNWSDGQLAFFLRTGIRPDGSYAPPYMPKFPLLSDYDLESIILFLRSDHPAVQPSEEEPPDSEPSFLTKMLTRTVIKAFDYSSSPIDHPDTSSVLDYGEYLVNVQMGCFQCHSADFKTNNDLDPNSSPGYLGGGNILYDMDGKIVLSPNITMDEETGIGNWSEAEFVNMMKSGKTPDGRTTKYPMLPYNTLTDKELSSIYSYLQSVPKISNRVSSE